MITAGYNFQLKAASAPPQSARISEQGYDCHHLSQACRLWVLAGGVLLHLAEAADGEPVHDASSWNVCAHGTVLSASPAAQPSRHTAQQVSSPAPPAVTVVSGTGSLATALAAAGMPPNRPLANPAARTRQGRHDAAMAVSRRWHGEDEHRILWMRSVSKLAPAAAAHRARRRHARPSRSRRGDGEGTGKRCEIGGDFRII